jgi:hypothetical protein
MEIRELEAFEACVRADDGLRTMLENVTRSVADEGERQPPLRVIDPADGLWLVALAGLWQVVKVGIQYVRGLSEMQIVAQRLEIIARVKALGFDEKHAVQVVERLLKDIRTRPDDDAVTKTLLKM